MADRHDVPRYPRRDRTESRTLCHPSTTRYGVAKRAAAIVQQTEATVTDCWAAGAMRDVLLVSVLQMAWLDLPVCLYHLLPANMQTRVSGVMAEDKETSMRHLTETILPQRAAVSGLAVERPMQILDRARRQMPPPLPLDPAVADTMLVGLPANHDPKQGVAVLQAVRRGCDSSCVSRGIGYPFRGNWPCSRR